MARIPQAQQTVAPQQGRSPGYASAADFGGDGGLGALAQGMSQLTAGIHAYQEQKGQFEASKLIQEERRNGLVAFEEQAETSELGDQNFHAKLDENTVSRHQQILDSARQNGMGKAALERLELGLDGVRTSVSERGIRFQSQSVGAKARNDINDMALSASQTVSMAPEEYGVVLGEVEASIDQLPGLDPVQRQQLKNDTKNSLTMSAALGLAEQEPQAVLSALSGSSEVYATDLPPLAQKFLGTIAAKESGGKYNVRYGGASGPQTFDSYADHPRQFSTITSGPHAGQKSSASGKYQFTAGTWDRAAKALGLTDFTPASQDRAAWWLAQQDYKSNTGRDLTADLQTGETARVRAGLKGTWEAFAKMNDAQFAQLVATGGGAMNKGKTGDPILDALPAAQRMQVMRAAQSKLTQAQSENRSRLQSVEQNALTALGMGETPAELPTPDMYQDAYGTAEEAQVAQERFEFARQAGEIAMSWGAASDTQIASDLQDIKDQLDPADPNYPQDVKVFEAAQKAAENVRSARQADPAVAVEKNFPAVRAKADQAVQALQNPEQRQDAMSGLYREMDAAYAQWGVPVQNRKYLTASLTSQVADIVDAENVSPADKIETLGSVVLSTSDPEQQRRIFDELVAKDPAIGKFAGVLDAYSRGEQRAAHRLAEAITAKDQDKLALPDGVTNSDIKNMFAERLDGGVPGVKYGVTAGVLGNGQRIGWDGELVLAAVRHRVLRGEELEDAFDAVERDIYGDVEVVDGDRVSVLVPAGTDGYLLTRGIDAQMPAVEERLRGLMTASDDPIMAGLSESAIEVALDEGVWIDDGDGNLMFALPGGKLVPDTPGGEEPFRLPLSAFLSAGQSDIDAETAAAMPQAAIAEAAPSVGGGFQLDSVRAAIEAARGGTLE